MSKTIKLNFNQPAPDLVLPDTTGQPVQLARLWAQRPLLLAFTRHFGCTECKEMLDELAQGQERIAAAGLRIAIMTQGSPEETARFVRQYAPGLLALCDPERRAYRAYGLERGGVFQTLINRQVWAGVARSRKKGFRVELPPKGQDVRQLSGTFIISPAGRVELPYYYDHIADHPPLDLLLSGVLSTRWDTRFDGPLGPAAHS